MPVTGINPMHIPTFSIVWNKSIAPTPAAMHLPAGFSHFAAVRSMRKIMANSTPQTMTAPIKPNSSQTVLKMKSVCFAGRNPSWFCVPCRYPLPKSPPEPTAIFD